MLLPGRIRIDYWWAENWIGEDMGEQLVGGRIVPQGVSRRQSGYEADSSSEGAHLVHFAGRFGISWGPAGKLEPRSFAGSMDRRDPISKT
jgi:hypothetical protein